MIRSPRMNVRILVANFLEKKSRQAKVSDIL